jgi:hypothetical protein
MDHLLTIVVGVVNGMQPTLPEVRAVTMELRDDEPVPNLAAVFGDGRTIVTTVVLSPLLEDQRQHARH